MVLAATSVVAQEVRIVRSTGTAEIEIPGRGWLQAVSGRLVPAGGSLATWTDAQLVAGGGTVEFQLGRLTIVELVSVESGRVNLRLRAGSLRFRTSEDPVTVTTDLAAFEIDVGAAEYTDGVLNVLEGSVTIAYNRGGESVVSAPAVLDIRELRIDPIF